MVEIARDRYADSAKVDQVLRIEITVCRD
jgi:hypothetical protein